MSTFTTISALQRYSDRELEILETVTEKRLARLPEVSAERREALATLHNIRTVIAQRRMRRTLEPPGP